MKSDKIVQSMLALLLGMGTWCEASFVTESRVQDADGREEEEEVEGGSGGGGDTGDNVTLFSSPFCGPAKENSEENVMEVVASEDLAPLVELWALDYINSCPNSWSVHVEVLPSDRVMARLCNRTAVMGGMSHDHLLVPGGTDRDGLVRTHNGWNYECLDDDDDNDDLSSSSSLSSVSIIQVEVALSILAVVTPIGSVAEECIRSLGGGLSIPQLQWMFGVLSESEIAKRSNADAILPGSDDRDETLRWSELADTFKAPQVAACPTATEITLVGDGIRQEEFMAALVESLPPDKDNDDDDGFRLTRLLRTFTNDITLLDAIVLGEKRFASLVEASPVAFVTYDFYRAHRNELSVVAIENPERGRFVVPTEETIEEGSYRPLTRRLYLNVVKEKEESSMWEHTAPFLQQSLGTTEGQDRVLEAGYRRLASWERLVMASRLGLEGGVDLNSVSCPPPSDDPDPLISIAGSSTVFPVAQLWSAIYQHACFNSTARISVEGGGSSKGAGRLCANPGSGPPVTIGDMSREWRASEARLLGEYVYRCNSPGDIARSAIQVPVAIDGLSVATQRGGIAHGCISALDGKGLTLPQLRWIFSNYLDDELAASDENWREEEVLPNSDKDPTSHKWSELKANDDRCPDVEIRIAGADVLSGTHEYFTDKVLLNYNVDEEEGGAMRREDFDTSRPYLSSPDDAEIVQYLVNYDNAIAYFGYAYYIEHQHILSAVAIQNPLTKEYVYPNASSVEGGSYRPLSRLIYMNLLNDEQALKHTAPFVTFGLSTDVGSTLVQATGYSLVPNRTALVDRLVYTPVPANDDAQNNNNNNNNNEGDPTSGATNDDDNSSSSDSSTNSSVAVFAGIFGGIGGFALIIFCFLLLRSRAKR